MGFELSDDRIGGENDARVESLQEDYDHLGLRGGLVHNGATYGEGNLIGPTTRPDGGNGIATEFNLGGPDNLFQNWGQHFNEVASAELPSEELFEIGAGDDFGWPYCFHDRARPHLRACAGGRTSARGLDKPPVRENQTFGVAAASFHQAWRSW